VEQPNEPIVLGIDLGGTKILSAICDRQGNMMSSDQRTTPSEKGQDAVIRTMAESGYRALEKSSVDIELVAAIGVGVPGPLNSQEGILYTAPNLPDWSDVPIKSILAQVFNKKVFVINDANAAAFAEYRFGAGRGSSYFIYITISTGIGGGMVIDGNIYTGASGTAAEIGHMTIDDAGPRCNCGNHGCWEALGSGSAMARQARKWVAESAPTRILEYADGNAENITALTIYRAAREDDKIAADIVAETAHYLGTGLANLINVYNPDVIALGGGLTRMGAMLLDPAYAVARKRSFKPAYQAVRIVTAELQKNSGVQGAAAYAFQQLSKSS
jgi:glucokinase